jgi:hypothetical protein
LLKNPNTCDTDTLRGSSINELQAASPTSKSNTTFLQQYDYRVSQFVQLSNDKTGARANDMS